MCERACVRDCVRACLRICVPEAGVCMCLMSNSDAPVKSPTLKYATLYNWGPVVEWVNKRLQVLFAVQRATAIVKVREGVFLHGMLYIQHCLLAVVG